MARKKAVPVEEKVVIPFSRMCSFFAGMFVSGLGMFLALSFLTADISLDPSQSALDCMTGLFGAWAAYGVEMTLGGVASYALAALIVMWGMKIIRGGEVFSTWPAVLGGVVVVFSLAMASAAFNGSGALDSGGIFASVLMEPAVMYLGSVGVLIVSAITMILGSVLAFGAVVFEVLSAAHEVGKRVAVALGVFVARTGMSTAVKLRPKIAALTVTAADRAVVVASKAAEKGKRKKRNEKEDKEVELEDEESEIMEEVMASVVEDEPEPEPEPELDEQVEIEFKPYGEDGEDDDIIAEDPYAQSRPKPKRQQKEKIDVVEVRSDQDPENYQLPPLGLLDEPDNKNSEDSSSLEKRARILENTLADFKIEGRVVRIECGPRVTMYEMTLAAGIKLSKVINLADNLAMALKAQNVRIIAPIPGKDTIGIELPNIQKNLVSLHEVVEPVDRANHKEKLPLCLSKDVSGQPLIADLAKMPHLLIAGATGSGKSVCINSIILSFLMCRKPSEVKLIMIDPKVVELSRFKGIPHLMSPVITDMKRAVGVLEWACQKMDERYEQLSMVGVNNISKFNAMGEKAINEKLEGEYAEEELHMFPKSLPYIVIIIDELADLMLVAGKEVETHITRLAAKSRAVGIHVILATQRPSVDVITGLIKANMPTRIAFQVASRVDSRTILDQNGAETLLGAGDMLYLPPGVGKLTRAQGVFVSDEELNRVVEFCSRQLKPQYHEDLEGPVIGNAGDVKLDDFDDLFMDAGMAIIESGRGSVSLLQRKLGIGYGRASRIVDQLASVGVLGPFREGKAREIMMTIEEFHETFAGSKGGKKAPLEPMAGVRDDEKGPQEMPWDE